MTLEEYNTVMKRLDRWVGVIVLGVFFGGIAVVAAVGFGVMWWLELPKGHWAGVPLSLLCFVPMLGAAFLFDRLHKKLGVKCPGCGQGLSMGRVSLYLRRFGGSCPRCGTLVVDRAAEKKTV